MMEAFKGVYLIRLDVDAWDWDEMSEYGFDFEWIPIFFKLDAQGKPTGETVSADEWGENIPKNMAPVMDEFFHGQ